jgi:branched-subunit amino acid aminotransferase/4-amino-4-deoxychorismate lyase
MTARTLPPDLDRPGAVVDCSIQVSDDDPLARHKTLNYWRKSIALADGAAAGSDDVLCVTPSGLICETCRANIFVIQHGRLHTPPLEGPLLPGVMRELVIRCASAIGLNVEEATVLLADVQSAEEVFLTNAVRGIVPVSQLLGREFPAPGPITADLRGRLLAWLFAGGSHG